MEIRRIAITIVLFCANLGAMTKWPQIGAVALIILGLGGLAVLSWKVAGILREPE